MSGKWGVVYSGHDQEERGKACHGERRGVDYDFFFFFFQAEDGIRVVGRSRGLGDVYEGQRFVVAAESQWSQLLVHAPVTDHRTGQNGYLLVVRLRPCRAFANDEGFGTTATETGDQMRLELGLGDGVALISEEGNHAHRLPLPLLHI